MSKGLVLLHDVTAIATKMYVVAGVNMGKQVYLAYDRHSGGYPWYPDSVYMAETFSSIERALKATKDSMVKRDLDKIKIMEIMLREIGNEEIDPNYAKAQDVINSLSPEVLEAVRQALK